MSIANVYGSVLTSLGALWTRFGWTVVWSAIVVGSLYSGISIFSGAFGLANAMALAYVVQTLGLKFYMRRAGNIADNNAEKK